MKGLRFEFLLPVGFLACAVAPRISSARRESSAIPVWGLEFPVTDVATAVHFYQETCGFDVESWFGGESDAVLASGDFRLVLRRTTAPASLSVSPCLNVRTSDAGESARAAKALGAEAPSLEPRDFPLGRWAEARDPSGNALRFLELDAEPLGPGERPRVFAVSLEALDLAAAESFFAALGYRVDRREALPDTLPLVHPGAASLLLRAQKKLGEPPFTSRGAVLLAVDSLASASADLRARGIGGLDSTRTRTAAGLSMKLAAPAGLPLKLVERSPARLAFERIRQLAGSWEGKSTQGWTDRLSLRAIARGTAVLETSFDAHPGETMATLFHMDGERLLLTHYCVAGNQPRLVATQFDEEGRRITFEFLDGGDLDSRDQGHMDKLVMTFDGKDRFTSRWTWYQAGHESWMEEIEHARVPQEAASPGTSSVETRPADDQGSHSTDNALPMFQVLPGGLGQKPGDGSR